MKKLQPIYAVPLKFGLVGGAMSVLLFAGIYFFGKNPLIVYRQFDFGFLLLPLFLFFSIREFRDFGNNGELRFWQGMTVGFLTYMIIAFISALFVWAFITFVDDQLLAGYIGDRLRLITMMKEEMIAQMGEAIYDRTYMEVQGITAVEVAVDEFLKKIFIGLFLTILISVFLRK